MRKLISSEVNAFGIETRWYWDEADRKVHVQRLQDVESNLSAYAAERNAYSDYRPFAKAQGLGTKVAEIPLGLYEQWRKEGFDAITGDDKELRRRLNDREFSKFRTAPGKL